MMHSYSSSSWQQLLEGVFHIDTISKSSLISSMIPSLMILDMWNQRIMNCLPDATIHERKQICPSERLGVNHHLICLPAIVSAQVVD